MVRWIRGQSVDCALDVAHDSGDVAQHLAIFLPAELLTLDDIEGGMAYLHRFDSAHSQWLRDNSNHLWPHTTDCNPVYYMHGREFELFLTASADAESVVQNALDELPPHIPRPR
jgi:hypothetical protein